MFQLILLDIGISGSTRAGDTSAITGLNSSLISIGTYAGAIIVALGILKLILSMQDQNPASKATAAMMLGGGILILSFSTIITILGLDNMSSSTSPSEVTKNVLEVVGSGMTFVGAILVILAIFQIIMSFLNEQAEEKAAASKLLATGIAFLCGKNIMTSVYNIALGSSTKGESIVKYIVNLLSSIAVYIGAGLAIFGVYRLIMAFRDEDVNCKTQAAMMIGVSIVLMSMRVVYQMFGL
jgi:Na+-transporting methylmalonyl-CoA/oxaloacetate decarboxylase gamma subunit